MTAEHFVLIVLLAVAICGGVTAGRQPGGIFFGYHTRLRDMTERGLWSKAWTYPVLLCETCMSSAWGIPIYLVVTICKGWVSLESILLIGPFVLVVAFCNYTVWTIIETLKSIKAYADARKSDHLDPRPGDRSDRN